MLPEPGGESRLNLQLRMGHPPVAPSVALRIEDSLPGPSRGSGLGESEVLDHPSCGGLTARTSRSPRIASRRSRAVSVPGTTIVVDPPHLGLDTSPPKRINSFSI